MNDELDELMIEYIKKQNILNNEFNEFMKATNITLNNLIITLKNLNNKLDKYDQPHALSHKESH